MGGDKEQSECQRIHDEIEDYVKRTMTVMIKWRDYDMTSSYVIFMLERHWLRGGTEQLIVTLLGCINSCT